MLSETENRLMTQVGPGTPGGEMLRRYWWPIEFSAPTSRTGR
jgi:5,5'-dehydrodivanillate O-demethylase